MLVMAKYSGEEGVGIRKICDKRNKQRMNILGTEVIEEVNVRNEKKYYVGEMLENT